MSLAASPSRRSLNIFISMTEQLSVQKVTHWDLQYGTSYGELLGILLALARMPEQWPNMRASFIYCQVSEPVLQKIFPNWQSHQGRRSKVQFAIFIKAKVLPHQ